jgi:predicted amidohydrolase
MTQITLALAQYRPARTPDELRSFADYAQKQRRWVQAATMRGAQLLVFPEYASLELSALQVPECRANVLASIAALQNHHAEFLALFQSLAREFSCVIVAPSFPLQLAFERKVVNRVYVCSPDQLGYQDKLMMTRFEREQWCVSGGSRGSVFQIDNLRFAVATCYDIEFPLISRSFAEAGAELIVVPSCTDTMAGYWRVRTGCAARALENQIFVAQAPLVGTVQYNDAIDRNVGRAGIFVAMDASGPEDGLVALADAEQDWLIRNLDLTLTQKMRTEGDVLTYQHWSEQTQVFASPVALTHLQLMRN